MHVAGAPPLPVAGRPCFQADPHGCNRLPPIHHDRQRREFYVGASRPLGGPASGWLQLAGACSGAGAQAPGDTFAGAHPGPRAPRMGGTLCTKALPSTTASVYDAATAHQRLSQPCSSWPTVFVLAHVNANFPLSATCPDEQVTLFKLLDRRTHAACVFYRCTAE